MRLSKKIMLGATVIIVLVNLVVVHLVGWRYQRQLQHEMTESARSFYRLVVVVRAWVAHNDGVYVLKREGVDANPYLSAPTLATVSGDTLVWRNPAMVTRELSALGDAMGKRVRFHITSLDPMNPENAPNDFERDALERFEAAPLAGPRVEEFTRFEEIEGRRHFRYFAPLLTEQSCLSCHTHAEVGDVRGGISIILPTDSSGAAADGYLLTLAGALVASAGVSLLLFLFLRRSVVQPLRRLEEAAAEIGRGNFETQILTNSSDEIGDVGRAMAKMQEAIRVSVGRQVETEKMVALGQLSAGIAHEIRNPLFAIRNDLDYLQRVHGGPGDHDEVYGEMEQGIERISNTVNAVLGYARPHRLEYGAHTVEQLLRPTLALLGKPLEKERVRVELALEPDLPPVEVDAHQMEQVFVNLLTNAMRAAPGGRIRVAARALDGQVEIRVEDDGHGIDPADLARVFDPFYTRAPGGTGLGLTIVRRILEQHHGSIAVESTPGAGTTFTLRLPERQPAPVSA